MDIDVLIGLFQNQSIPITLVSCCLCGYSSFAPHTDLVTVPPSPSINYSLQQEDTTVSVIKKFQHILGLYSSS